MISRSPLQTVWHRESAAGSSLVLGQAATHYSFSVSDEYTVFMVQHRAEEEADYLIVTNLLTNQICELKFAPIRISNNTAKTRIWTFEECGPGFGIINFRTNQQTFGVAICSLNYRTRVVYSEEIQLLTLHPNVPDTIYTTRKAQNGKIYLLEDPVFPMQMYNLEHGYVDSDSSIRLHYNIQHRRHEIEGRPDEYLCINDGIDKTCCKLSVFLAHRSTGSVHNYVTKLAQDEFPLKCNDRLVGNMQSVPFKDGILALFRYEPKEAEQLELNAFAYLDLNTLQWQDLNIKLSAQFVQFQVVGPADNILMIMETENDMNANPVLKAVYRLKIGSLESLQKLCYYALLKYMPQVRTMTDEERRENGIIYFS